MSRCRACNTPLRSNEVIWYRDIHRYEELCTKCRTEVFKEYIAMDWDISSTTLYYDDLIQRSCDDISR